MTRFDLEQTILESWKIISDIQLMTKQGAPAEDYAALATVYEHRFQDLWDTFEGACFPAAQSSPELPTTARSIIRQGVREVVFQDEDRKEVRLSYGRYDGELIFGVDSSLESFSMRIDDLSVLIPTLYFLNKAAK